MQNRKEVDRAHALSESYPSQSSKKDGTVLKTFRIPKHLYSVLELEAKARGLSPNALVSMIFTKFANWDRYSTRFGYVSIS